MSWIIGENGYPTNTDFIEITENYIEKPYPLALWRIEDNAKYPSNELFLDTELLGAFANATKLQEVSIPKSVKKIGRYSFRNTNLKSVTISRDCEYYPTSFPDGCVVNFYGGNLNSFKTADGLTFWTRDNLKFGVKEG